LIRRAPDRRATGAAAAPVALADGRGRAGSTRVRAAARARGRRRAARARGAVADRGAARRIAAERQALGPRADGLFAVRRRNAGTDGARDVACLALTRADAVA